MKIGVNVQKFAGIAAAAVYIAMTLLSHLHNKAIGPITNWLSDYGSPQINPSGAIFYNAGCIITAALLAVFYTGMISWHRSSQRKLVICYACAEVSGYFASVFLILASLLPIYTTPLHGTFSMLNMIGIDCFLMFTAIAAFLHPHKSRAIGFLGFLAAVFNIITTNMFKELYIAEWIFFASFIAYIALLTYNYERFRSHNGEERSLAAAL